MEDKTKTMLSHIEKLIVDGNKEVLKRLDNLEAGQHTLEAGQHTLEAGQTRIEKEVERLGKTLNATAQASYDLLTDVNRKLDEHIRQPAHA